VIGNDESRDSIGKNNDNLLRSISNR